MTSPSRLLLFAVFVAAFVAYFGDHFIALSNKAGESIKEVAHKSSNELVYDKANMAEYNGDIRVPIAQDGHYWVTIEVNGVPVLFVVDTGASHISLSYQDARKTGLDPEFLNYDKVFKTANGETRKAIISLDRVSMDAIEMSNVMASVSQQGQMDISLLGMSFLSRLSGFMVEDGQLILRP